MYYSLISSMTKAVSGGIDSDATAFITAAGITDPTQQGAINTLVLSLKSYGVWTKIKAIYPMVGGTATTHKYNLKDPRDLDAAFRLQFNGGWTHSSTGAKPNGTTGYADTFLIPSTSLSTSSVHTSYYSRDNITLTSNQIFFDAFIGANQCYQSYFDLTGPNWVSDSFDVNNGRVSSPITNFSSRTDGFFIANRTSSIINKLQRNLSILSSTGGTFANTGSILPYIKLFMSAANTTGGAVVFSKLEVGLSSIGDGFTDTEASNFYTAVQQFQTTLGRQV